MNSDINNEAVVEEEESIERRGDGGEGEASVEMGAGCGNRRE